MGEGLKRAFAAARATRKKKPAHVASEKEARCPKLYAGMPNMQCQLSVGHKGPHKHPVPIYDGYGTEPSDDDAAPSPAPQCEPTIKCEWCGISYGLSEWDRNSDDCPNCEHRKGTHPDAETPQTCAAPAASKELHRKDAVLAREREVIVAPFKARIAKLEDVVRWIASQQNLFFAECSLAEEIVFRCKAVLVDPAPRCKLNPFETEPCHHTSCQAEQPKRSHKNRCKFGNDTCTGINGKSMFICRDCVEAANFYDEHYPPQGGLL